MTEAGSWCPVANEPDPNESRKLRERVAELEHRLRAIGAEVHASGLLDEAAGMPADSSHPSLAYLTSRQRQILTRLVRGERTQTIAAEMYISPSTVRNHLTAIFRKFGVHSQAALLASLRDQAATAARPS